MEIPLKSHGHIAPPTRWSKPTVFVGFTPGFGDTVKYLVVRLNRQLKRDVKKAATNGKRVTWRRVLRQLRTAGMIFARRIREILRCRTSLNIFEPISLVTKKQRSAMFYLDIWRAASSIGLFWISKFHEISKVWWANWAVWGEQIKALRNHDWGSCI